MIRDAAKVASAAWAALWIEPWTEQTLSTFGKPVQFLVSAVIAAVVLEFVWQILLGWPRIQVSWAVKGEDAPITEVLARIRTGNAESQVFWLKVSAPSGGWIGYQLLRLSLRTGAVLQVRIERASVVPTCEASFKAGGIPTVTSDDTTNGFTVALGPAPRRPGPWHWAQVRWRDESTPRDDEFNIEYVLHHEKPFVRFLLNTFIWRSSNARKFRVVGP